MNSLNIVQRLRVPRTAYTSYYIAQFLFLGVYLPFFPGWLDERGFSAASIGALTGGTLIMRLALAPPLAYRAETLSDPRTGMRLTSAAMAFFLIVLLIPMPPIMIGILTIGVWFLFGVLVPLTDTAVLRADRRGELSYGISRGLGSASFIVASLIGGAIITRVGVNAVVFWCAAAGVMAFGASMLLPREPEAIEARPRPSLAFAAALFRSRSFLLMLMAAGLAQGAHATYYAFSELHWSSLGYSSLTIGLLWAVGVVCEIVFLFLARPLVGRVGAPLLIMSGTLAAAIRWPLTGLSPPLAILFVLQALHAFTFAAAYIGAVEFIDKAIPSAYRTTAMTVVSTFGVGAVTGLATVGVGLIFDRSAPLPAYMVMGGMGVVGTMLAFALWRRWDGGLIKAVPADGPIEN